MKNFKVCYEVDKCCKCPFVRARLMKVSDAKNLAFDYECKLNDKKIAGFIERLSEMPDIPDWCPLQEKK